MEQTASECALQMKWFDELTTRELYEEFLEDGIPHVKMSRKSLSFACISIDGAI